MESSNLVLIDFGNAQKFENEDKEHIKFKPGQPFTGNVLFASPNIFRGYLQSRRDDILSLA